MSDRLPEKRRFRPHFETEWERTKRETTHYYISAVIIAFGLFMVGGFAVAEGKRILNGDFNKLTYKMHEQLPKDAPIDSWLPDAWYASGIVLSAAMMGYGIYLRRNTRDPR